MSNRYVTDAEKAGATRRSDNYRQRLREAGLRPRTIWASDAEVERLKALLAHWRGEDSGLGQVERDAADVLRPVAVVKK